MPAKLSVGISRKITLSQNGSLEAGCHVELDIPGTLLMGDQQRFQSQVRSAYLACAEAVDDELARQQAGATSDRRRVEAGRTKPPPDAPPAQPDAGNSVGGRQPARRGDPANGAAAKGAAGNSHGVSRKQLDYIQQLARQVPELGTRRLDALTRRMYGRPAADLTSLEASSLIDTLKAAKAGEIHLEHVFSGEAT
jgi:hypothetical protein